MKSKTNSPKNFQKNSNAPFHSNPGSPGRFPAFARLTALMLAICGLGLGLACASQQSTAPKNEAREAKPTTEERAESERVDDSPEDAARDSLDRIRGDRRKPDADESLTETKPDAPLARTAAIDSMRLTRGMRSALSSYDPGFFVSGCRGSNQLGGVQPQDAAFSVEGDFNGDGSMDLAVLGMTESHRALLALFCAGDNCSVQEMERWPRTRRAECEGRLFLKAEAPGLKISPHESRPLRLRNDAVRIFYARAAQAILYYQNESFNSYILKD